MVGMIGLIVPNRSPQVAVTVTGSMRCPGWRGPRCLEKCGRNVDLAFVGYKFWSCKSPLHRGGWVGGVVVVVVVVRSQYLAPAPVLGGAECRQNRQNPPTLTITHQYSHTMADEGTMVMPLICEDLEDDEQGAATVLPVNAASSKKYTPAGQDWMRCLRSCQARGEFCSCAEADAAAAFRAPTRHDAAAANPARHDAIAANVGRRGLARQQTRSLGAPTSLPSAALGDAKLLRELLRLRESLLEADLEEDKPFVGVALAMATAAMDRIHELTSQPSLNKFCEVHLRLNDLHHGESPDSNTVEPLANRCLAVSPASSLSHRTLSWLSCHSQRATA